VLKEVKYRCLAFYREPAIVFLLMVLAFAVRVHRVDFNSLSEDESAKWAAVQEYRHGHFAGVNSEHPMLPKMMAWASLTAGEQWSGIAARHGWPSLKPEGWLRMPNVVLGAATAAVLFLLCRQMMGLAGSFAASFFWAVAPLPIALNRLTKEETPLTFFTLLACYFYCRARQTDADQSSRRWFDLSAIGFGLALASQYILHLLGLNALAWFLANKFGLGPQKSQFGYKRFFVILFLTFILVNPVILSPSNLSGILHWLHHDGVRHSGYDFDGTLYMNFPARLLTGVPWFYYLWLMLVKTPIPILIAVILGSALLLRDRRTLASCFFLSLGMLQFIGLSVSGAKWIRYSLPMLPFFFLAGGYAVQKMWNSAKGSGFSPVVVRAIAIVVIGWPLLELQAWMPYYSFYLNSIGGGARNITRYFAPDEVSEFDTREVAQRVCPFAPVATRVATARPMSMAYYFQACGRTDIQIVPLYDPHYVPSDGDLIVLEPSRRFFETQRFFDTLTRSRVSRTEVHVGPVCASTIYRFDTSAPEPSSAQPDVALAQLRRPGPRFDSNVHESVSTQVTRFGLSDLARRLVR
jgi:hypothetical protein